MSTTPGAVSPVGKLSRGLEPLYLHQGCWWLGASGVQGKTALWPGAWKGFFGGEKTEAKP